MLLYNVLAFHGTVHAKLEHNRLQAGVQDASVQQAGAITLACDTLASMSQSRVAFMLVVYTWDGCPVLNGRLCWLQLTVLC